MDKDVSQKLQLEADLTLERAIHLARQSEQVKQQSAECMETTVNEVRRKQYNSTRRSYEKPRQGQGQKYSENKLNCQRCNRMHDKKESCPTKGAESAIKSDISRPCLNPRC